MRLPRWLDRIWLVLIACSAVLMTFAWLYTWSQTYGVRPVATGVAVFLIALYQRSRRQP